MSEERLEKDDIIRIKRFLSDLGYYEGEITGRQDSGLDLAVLRFQREHDMVANTIIDEEFLRKLEGAHRWYQPEAQKASPFAISLPLTKDGIISIQQQLSVLGYYKGRIDGRDDADVARAVYAFQDDHNLRAHGIVDRDFLDYLDNSFKGWRLRNPDAELPSPVHGTVQLEERSVPAPSSDSHESETTLVTRTFTAPPMMETEPRDPPEVALPEVNDDMNVKDIKRRLTNLKAYLGPLNNVADQQYEDAVAEFQIRQNFFPNGKMSPELLKVLVKEHAELGLTPGQVLANNGLTPTDDPARDALRAQLFIHAGVIEDPDNRGFDVDRYIGEGNAWCAGFLSYNFEQIIQEAGADSNSNPLRGLGSNRDFKNKAQSIGVLHKGSDPEDPYIVKPGDVILQLYEYGPDGINQGRPTPQRYSGHTITVLEIDEDRGIVYTIGGNHHDRVAIRANPYDMILNEDGSLRDYSGEVENWADAYVMDMGKVAEISGLREALENNPEITLTAPAAPAENYKDYARLFHPTARYLLGYAASGFPSDTPDITPDVTRALYRLPFDDETGYPIENVTPPILIANYNAYVADNREGLVRSTVVRGFRDRLLTLAEIRDMSRDPSIGHFDERRDAPRMLDGHFRARGTEDALQSEVQRQMNAAAAADHDPGAQMRRAMQEMGIEDHGVAAGVLGSDVNLNVQDLQGLQHSP